MNQGHLGKNTNVTKSAKKTIKDYCLANGLDREDIAMDLGIVKGTLDNKLKPSALDALLTVEEVLELCEITDDDSILKAMCAERGLTVFDPIEAMPDGGDIVNGLLMGVLEISSLTGNLSNLTKEASEDGKIDKKETSDINKILEMMRGMERKIELMLKNNMKEIDENE